jgi:Ca-activated chloride channel family protein
VVDCPLSSLFLHPFRCEVNLHPVFTALTVFTPLQVETVLHLFLPLWASKCVSYNSRVFSIRLIACFVLLTGCLSVSAQSGRGVQGGDQKKAVRVELNATPTPTPKAQPTPLADASAQATPSSVDGDIIKVDTQLVSLPVRVMDKKGRFVAGLRQDEFQVFENGVEQEISYFSTEEEPFTVVLMLDMSYSTKFKLDEIQNAALAFIDQLRPVDKVAVVSFDEEVHVLCKPTSDRKEVYRAIRSTKIDTGTSLYEAVDLVMNSLTRSVQGRKAIILFSDGVDTTSRRANDMNNISDAIEFDALIYPIRYDTYQDVQDMKNHGGTARPVIVPPVKDPTKPPQSTADVILSSIKNTAIGTTAGIPNPEGTSKEDYEKAGYYMQQLADRTGGRLYEATSTGNLANAYSKIASELREFYSIGYYPKSDRTTGGKQASVKVKTTRDGLVVRSREQFIKRKKAGN